MDQQRKLEIGARIKDLRERSPYTQEALAERLDVTLRGYQRMEQTGGMRYSNLERLAEIHKVDPDWILRGDEPEQAGGDDDLQVQLDGITTRLAALETAVQTVVALLRQEAQEELDEPDDDTQLGGEEAPNATPTPLPREPRGRGQRREE